MLKNVQDDALKCLVLYTTQRCSVYCHRGGKKPGNIHILMTGIREFLTFLSLNNTQTD